MTVPDSIVPAAGQAAADFRYEFPYRHARMPLFAGDCVATSQPLAASAGLRMLLKGGSAADAAIATAIALTVVEPTMNGIGSDAFAILWDGAALSGINASGRSPALMTRARFAGLDAMPEIGWDAVTVPGCVSLWAALHARHGRLPFADLFEPAIRCAEDGYRVSPMIAAQWARQIPKLKDQPGFAEHFMPHGRAPLPGETVRLPHHARTLRLIAESGGEAYYRGELAERIARFSEQCGATMRASDLADHRADWVEPVKLDYRGTTLHEIPPNGQGIAACMALGMLEAFDLAGLDPDGAEVAHLRIETMKLAFADAYRHVADPAHMEVSPAELLDRAYLRGRAALIDRRRAQDFGPGMPRPSGTVYLTAADSRGMMVSLIQSNYAGFGSGVVVPGTGIALQNRGFGFTLAKGHPNEVGPGKRPFHTIIPGFLTRGGRPLASFGIMGGNVQPQAHMQVVSRIVDFGQNPQTAIDGPRWRIQGDGEVWLEPHLPAATGDALEGMGHRVRRTDWPSVDFGSGQMIWRFEDGGPYLAASESRRDGQALGF